MGPEDPPELGAFVLDDDIWHELQPLEQHKDGLGKNATCELDVRDINIDGRLEILVWGHADSSTDILHVFAWDGESYALLSPFEGPAGIRLEDRDGDLAEEIVVRYKADHGFAWEAVHTWDGTNYGWTWERYAWFHLDRPHAYQTDTPEHAVISYYLALNDRDLPGAYSVLSPRAQMAQPIREWMGGFGTTVSVEAGSVHELTRAESTATVTAQVRAYDNEAGRVVASLWDVNWIAVHTGSGWLLDHSAAEQLDNWEVEYQR